MQREAVIQDQTAVRRSEVSLLVVGDPGLPYSSASVHESILESRKSMFGK